MMEVQIMNVRHIILSVLIAMVFMSGLSLAEDSGQTMDASVNESINKEVVETSDNVTEAVEASDNVTTEDTADESQSLEGIWLFPEMGITLVMHQSGDDLFGAATCEDPEPWNAVMTGSISGDKIELNTLSPQNCVLVSVKITATVSDDTITGSFIQADSLGNVKHGDVMGLRTALDTAGYEPAAVAATPTVPAQEDTTATSNTGDEIKTETQTGSENEESKYFKISASEPRRSTSDEIFTTARVVPLGMG
ncbi:MAG: hypothetical protein ACXQT4_05250 [Methanotrichaceae archaeon]